MLAAGKDIDITRNLRIVEMLKAEILTEISCLYKSLCLNDNLEARLKLGDSLANMIILSYILGKRLGIEYATIEKNIKNKIKLGIIENTEIEKYYGDLSELAKIKNPN